MLSKWDKQDKYHLGKIGMMSNKKLCIKALNLNTHKIQSSKKNFLKLVKDKLFNTLATITTGVMV
jgi:hypothetical protein